MPQAGHGIHQLLAARDSVNLRGNMGGAYFRLIGLEDCLLHTSFHDINETHKQYFTNLHIHFNIRMKNALDLHILFFIWSLKTNVPSTAASGKWFKQIHACHDQIRSRGPPHTEL